MEFDQGSVVSEAPRHPPAFSLEGLSEKLQAFLALKAEDYGEREELGSSERSPGSSAGEHSVKPLRRQSTTAAKASSIGSDPAFHRQGSTQGQVTQREVKRPRSAEANGYPDRTISAEPRKTRAQVNHARSSVYERRSDEAGAQKESHEDQEQETRREERTGKKTKISEFLAKSSGSRSSGVQEQVVSSQGTPETIEDTAGIGAERTAGGKELSHEPRSKIRRFLENAGLLAPQSDVEEEEVKVGVVEEDESQSAGKSRLARFLDNAKRGVEVTSEEGANSPQSQENTEQAQEHPDRKVTKSGVVQKFRKRNFARKSQKLLKRNPKTKTLHRSEGSTTPIDRESRISIKKERAGSPTPVADGINEEPEFSPIYQVGLLAWRIVDSIEGYKAARVSEVCVGEFYEEDCYLIASTKLKRCGSQRHDIHMWLGARASKSLRSAALKKMVQLYQVLEGKAVLYRENEYHESHMLQSYYNLAGMKHLRSDWSRGFRRQSVSTRKRYVRLLLVKRNPKCCQFYEVDCTAKAVNEGRVCILDVGSEIYAYFGRKSDLRSRYGAQVELNRVSGSRSGKTKVHILEKNAVSSIVRERST